VVLLMNRLKDLREDRDLKQGEVGQVLGVSKQAISHYELETRALTPELIHKFCDFYGVTADYLLGRSNQPRPSMSKLDIELLQAYHAAPLEIRRIIDTALAPYREEVQSDAAAAG